MSYYSANQPLTEPRPGSTVSTGPRPTLAGPEADEKFRRHITDLAGPASSEPLSATLAGLIASWFAPVSVGRDGALLGRLDGNAVQVNTPTVRDLLRRTDLGGQLGITVTAADIDAALPLVARQARVEAERRAVAEQHQADRARTELAEDVERAERRAELLRELAELEGRPASPAEPAERPVPGPTKRLWQR